MTIGHYNCSSKQRTQLKNILPLLFMPQLTIRSSYQPTASNSVLTCTTLMNNRTPTLIFDLQQRTPEFGVRDRVMSLQQLCIRFTGQPGHFPPACSTWIQSVGSEAEGKMQMENIAGNGKNYSLPNFPFLHLIITYRKVKHYFCLRSHLNFFSLQTALSPHFSQSRAISPSSQTL